MCEKTNADLVNGSENELGESTVVSITTGLVPLFILGVVEVVTPESLHQLGLLDSELGRVQLSELLQRESPAMQTGAETHGSFHWVDGNIAHGAIVIAVGGDDDVDVLDDSLQGLVQILFLQLQSQECQVHLVHEEDRLDSLSDGLTQHGFSLHTHTYQKNGQQKCHCHMNGSIFQLLCYQQNTRAIGSVV